MFYFQDLRCTIRLSVDISNVNDWMFVPCLSLISISSYVVQGTKETGNIDTLVIFTKSDNFFLALDVFSSFSSSQL